jgi:hypothetical protein
MLTAGQIDQIIKAAFADEGDESTYGNGLCRAFAIGLDAFLRLEEPSLYANLLIGHHDGGFDHCALYLHRCGAAFDWQGAGAQQR